MTEDAISSRLEVREAVPDDSPRVAALLGEVFPTNPKRHEDVLRWQYWSNPFALAGPSSWVCLDGDRVVCHNKAVHVPLLIGGTPATGAVSVDSATARDYRGRGIFSRLTRKALRESRPAEATIFFPAPSSMLPSVTKAPFGPLESHGFPLDLFALPLRSEWWASRTRLPKPLATVILSTVMRVPGPQGAHEVAAPPADLDALWDRIKHETPYGIRKDMEWWKWRYEARPRSDYRFFEHRTTTLTGVAVTSTPPHGEGSVYILDFLTNEPRTARSLLGAIARAFPDAPAVAFRATRGSIAARMARAATMRPVPARFDRDPPLVVIAALSENHAPEETPWCITWGDMDHL